MYECMCARWIPFRHCSLNRAAFWHSEEEPENKKDFSGSNLERGVFLRCASGVIETEVGHSRRKGLALAHCDNGKIQNDVVVGLGFRPFPGYRSMKRYDEAASRAIISASCVYNMHRQPGTLSSSRKNDPRNLCSNKVDSSSIRRKLFDQTNLSVELSVIWIYTKLKIV